MVGSIKDNYTVKSIKKRETHDWLLNKHYAKAIPSISYAFGLYENSKLVGVCCYGNGAVNLAGSIVPKHKDKKHYELNRLVTEELPKNALSYFVSKTMKKINKPSVLVSYADGNQGHNGYIYQATNWIYTGITGTEKKYYDTRNGKRLHSHTVVDIYGSRSKEKLPEFIEVVDELVGKHRYVFFNGSKTFKNDCELFMRYKELPYPKGENENYDASYKPQTQATLW